MSQIVYFDGVRLVKPGGASKIDASAFDAALSDGSDSIAIVGEAAKGKPGEVIAFTSASAMEQYFGSGALAEAARVAFRPLSDARIGARQANVVYAYKTNASTQASHVLKDSAAADVIKLTAAEYGVGGNALKVTVASSGDTRTFTFQKGTDPAVETIAVNAKAKFSLLYTGSEATPTVSLTDSGSDGVVDSIALTAAGGADALTITFATAGINTIADLVAAINASPVSAKWTATVVNADDANQFSPAQLDTLSSAEVATSPAAATSIYARAQDCINAINAKSQLVTAALPASPTKRAGPADLAATTFSTAAVLGGSSNSSFAAAFTALEKVETPHVAVAASKDGSGSSTFTISAVLTQLDAHCAKMSATGGKKERTGYGAITGSKSTVRAKAQALNSFHTVLFCQKMGALDALGASVTYDEWAFAVAAASARAGMDPGEPLTWKYLNATSVSQDASWTPEVDGDDMILAGLCIIEQDRRGVKVVKGITTYTRTDNDVYTEESIITNVKAMSKAFREMLELRYTGRKATTQMLNSIKADAIEFWSQMRTDGRIVDSVAGGQITKLAYRKIEIRIVRDRVFVDVEISPVQGINFQLETIRLVPATMSA